MPRKKKAKAAPEPIEAVRGNRVASVDDARVAQRGECPVCFGSLYQLDGFMYCSAEDPHPGGVVVYDDGRARRADRHLATTEA